MPSHSLNHFNEPTIQPGLWWICDLKMQDKFNLYTFVFIVAETNRDNKELDAKSKDSKLYSIVTKQYAIPRKYLMKLLPLHKQLFLMHNN